MVQKLKIVDRDTGETVAIAYPEKQELDKLTETTNSERYLPNDDVKIFAGSPASAKNALVDETERDPESAQEYAGAIRGRLAGTGLDVYEEAKTVNSTPPTDPTSANTTRYSENDPVQTPQGFGIVTEVRTENFEGKDGEVEASESSPTYVVGLKDGRVGVGFYKASELREDELPDTDVDDPVDSLADQSANSAVSKILDATPLRANDFTMPETWRESDTPARVILLKAWAGMNGQFDCGGDCCKGELMSSGMSERGANRVCASMKDEVLGGWEGWRK